MSAISNWVKAIWPRRPGHGLREAIDRADEEVTISAQQRRRLVEHGLLPQKPPIDWLERAYLEGRNDSST